MISGLLVIDKPTGPSSHDVVQECRRLLKTKVGHAGTLDPLASGVLVLLLGRATRLARFLQITDKEYLAEIRFGQSTPTFDREGEIVEEKPVPPISRQGAQEVLAQFRGEIEQLPPLFSAVKVGGQRLYQIARRKDRCVGQQRARLEKERPSRKVTIYRLDLLTHSANLWTLAVHCSAGTYIRALAHDLGQAVGCGAHLQDLRRTRSGHFDLSRALTLQEAAKDWQNGFISMDELLTELPRLDLEETQADRVQHGTPIYWERESIEGFCRLFYKQSLIAVGKAQENRIDPKIVLI